MAHLPPMPDGSKYLHESMTKSDATVAPAHRDVRLSMLRGWRTRCPRCGGGPLYEGYCKVRARCASCGEPFHHHRADDLPAWATILIVGHLMVSALLWVELAWKPPLWVHWSVWPAVTLLMVLWLLPRIKGVVVSWQWAQRHHGFEHGRSGTEEPRKS